jgi:hypothetical protein
MTLNASLTTFTPDTVIHASDVNTNFANLNDADKFVGTFSSQVGFNTNGINDTGIMENYQPISLATPNNLSLRHNCKWDGTNDRFFTNVSAAYQFWLDNGGIHYRKSTNTPVGNAIITWGTTHDLLT